MYKLIIYLSEDHNVKRVLTYHSGIHFDPDKAKKSVKIQMREFAKEICSDAGDKYYGCSIIDQ